MNLPKEFVSIWIIYFIYFVQIGDSISSDLFPVNIIGTKKLITPNDLSCDVFQTQSMHNIHSYKIKLPFQESNTRSGYFCSQTNVTINCLAGWFSYHFSTEVTKLPVSEEICKQAVEKFKGGHIGGSIMSTPECVYWSHSTKKGDNFIVVSNVMLPFSTEHNGVTSSVFSNSVCQNKQCLTKDSKTYWFLRDDEESGCTQLRSGFLEVSSIIRPMKSSKLITTNLFKNVLWDSLCVGPTYCGHSSIVGPNHQAFLPDISELDLNNLISSNLSLCAPGVKIRELSQQNFISLSDYKTDLRMALHICTIKLNEMKANQKLTDNQLSIFEPLEEGIYPGYRIEGDKLYQYNLLYLLGEFLSYSTGSSGNDYIWEIHDLSNHRHPLSHSLCLFDDDRPLIMGGGICNWFNGMRIKGSKLYKPSYFNSFSTRGQLNHLPFLSSEVLNVTTNSSNKSSWLTNIDIIILIPLFGFFILIIILISSYSIKKIKGKQSTPYTVELAESNAEVPIPMDLIPSESVINNQNSNPFKLVILNSTSPRQTIPAISGINKPMLNW